MTEWTQGNERVQRQDGGDLGGTMRLGAYDAILGAGLDDRAASTARRPISERHRHRYEVNIRYRDMLERVGPAYRRALARRRAARDD